MRASAGLTRVEDYNVICLVLERADTNGPEYKRLGLGFMASLSWFEGSGGDDAGGGSLVADFRIV